MISATPAYMEKATQPNPIAAPVIHSDIVYLINSSFDAYGMKAFKKGKCNAPRV